MKPGPMSAKHRTAQGSVLFYKSSRYFSRQIEAVIVGLNDRIATEVIGEFDILENRLRTQGIPIVIIVLSVPNREVMTDLMKLGKLLEDVPLVIVAPENDEATLVMAHSLRPRYVASHEDNPDLLVYIIENIAGLYRQRD